ncbi:MAG: hypothetical protein HY897_15210 [Deltaproteobacteria bacterium]|nr:hypothetical protein [Deltaproteobacteria bacterium]
MFGFGAVCDRLLGEVVPEEYMWIADLGCAGLDAATGNWGNAVSLGMKAVEDGAAAAGNKDLAQKVGIANQAQDIITTDMLNQAELASKDLGSVTYCTEDRSLMMCRMSVAQKTAIRASAAAGGAGIGAAKGGKIEDYREGLAIGAAGSRLCARDIPVEINPEADVKTLMSHASVLGRNTVGLATAVAVAAQDSQSDKRIAGAVGGIVGSAIDLPSAALDLADGEEDLERVLAAERMIQDTGSIALNTCKARLRASDRGKTETRASNIFDGSAEIIKGATQEIGKAK